MEKLLDHSPYLRACKQLPTKKIPIWLMRQAGRYMPVYRALRSKYEFLQLVKTPELAAEITMQPIREFGFDAAIIFADILPILEGMGLDLKFQKGDGPLISNPVRELKDIENLRATNVENDLHFTLDAIKIVKEDLKKFSTPLIGFSGSPFTLAAYAIEGQGSKTYLKTLSLMHAHPEHWHQLMTKLSDAVHDYLVAQVNVGVQSLQIFDSWAGLLCPTDYEQFVLPYVKNIVEKLKCVDVPVTYFSTQTTSYFNLLNQVGSDVLGIDWRINIKEAYAKKSERYALQGNFSPALLLGSRSDVKKYAEKFLVDLKEVNPKFKGFIFNLGHGIYQNTPMENVHQLIECVRNYALD